MIFYFEIAKLPNPSYRHGRRERREREGPTARTISGGYPYSRREFLYRRLTEATKTTSQAQSAEKEAGGLFHLSSRRALKICVSLGQNGK